MAKYLAVHPVEPPVSMDSVGPLAQKAKAGVTPDAYWVKSWCELNDNGEVTAVYCEWDGKDALTRLIPELPFSKVSTMSEIQGEDFR